MVRSASREDKSKKCFLGTLCDVMTIGYVMVVIWFILIWNVTGAGEGDGIYRAGHWPCWDTAFLLERKFQTWCRAPLER